MLKNSLLNRLQNIATSVGAERELTAHLQWAVHSKCTAGTSSPWGNLITIKKALAIMLENMTVAFWQNAEEKFAAEDI